MVVEKILVYYMFGGDELNSSETLLLPVEGETVRINGECRSVKKVIRNVSAGGEFFDVYLESYTNNRGKL